MQYQRLLVSNLNNPTLSAGSPSPHHHFLKPLLRKGGSKNNGSSQVKFTSVHAGNKKNTSSEHEDFARINQNYHSNIWGDRFLNYTQEDDKRAEAIKKEVQRLKENVKEELLAARCDSFQCLNYINILELLGVAYHFDNEIEEGLQHIHENYCDWDEEDDLYRMSLRFRLLRQHGFYVPSDAFRKFKDKKGGFKESLTTDVQGMLAFYEASHVRIHGEDILDEALNFTTAHLRSMATQLSNPLKIQVTHALRFPLHKFWSRLDHCHHISVFENDPSLDKTLLKFAKLDFNLIQLLHKKELSCLTRWWKGQECSTQLSFSRDRMVENYYIFATTHYEPQYAGFRIAFTKVGTVLTIIDDIYDGYGTIEELEILTKAFERWDRSCVHQLPNYMKPSYKALLEIYEEIEQYLARKGKANCIELIRKTAMDVMRGSLQYAKWFHANCHPPYNEYLTNASTALGCHLVYDCCFIFNGEIPPDEVLEWANQYPKPLKDHAKKCRLLNDLTASGRLRDGTLSTITCYMKHYNVSEEEATEELLKQLDDFQKDWNKETLRPSVMPVPIMNSLTKLARCGEVLYFNGEDPIAVVTQIHEENIAKMFRDPFPV